jgi:hypothetical protein
MVKDLSAQALFKAASAFNAEIILKRDDNGDALVDRVLFVQKPK